MSSSIICVCAAVLLDTKGPEIRTGFFADGKKKIDLVKGESIILTSDYSFKGSSAKLACSYQSLAKSVRAGQEILVADGSLVLTVLSTDEALGEVTARIENNASIGGTGIGMWFVALMRNEQTNASNTSSTLCCGSESTERKNMNLPGTATATSVTILSILLTQHIPYQCIVFRRSSGVVVDLPTLTDKDIDDIVNWGIKYDVDFVAASFVRKASDVAYIREVLEKNGGSGIKIISKIENQEGLNNYPEILDISDGIMVARGDLGMEIVRASCLCRRFM
jgi:pyruvate kinase